MRNYVKAYGQQLFSNGYLPVRIRPWSKIPVLKNWVNRAVSNWEQPQTMTSAEGLGLLCGTGENPVCILDFDIPDEEVSREIRDRVVCEYPELMEAICRVGKAPKFSLIVRADSEGWCKASTAKFSRSGLPKAQDPTCSQLEVLGAGQQSVVYNIHPATGREYVFEYPCAAAEFFVSGIRTPLNTPAMNLPVVSRETVSAIMTMVTEEFERLGMKPVNGRRDGTPLAAASEDPEESAERRKPLGMSLEQIKATFEELQWDWETYDSWLDGGMRIHFETQGSKDGLRLWNTLSSGAANYGGAEVCAAKWQSFHRFAGSVRTMQPLVRRTGLLDAFMLPLNEEGMRRRALSYFGNRLWFVGSGAMLKPYLFDENTRKWETERGESAVFTELHEEVFGRRLTEEKRLADEEWAEQIEKFQRKFGNNLYVQTMRMYNILKRDTSLGCSASVFNADHTRFAVKNGVINLTAYAEGRLDEVLEENRPELKMTYSGNAEYDPEATCPLWDKCMSEWFVDNPEIIPYIYRILGSALTGDPQDDVFVFMVGEGNNGKTCFSKALRNLFGGYATSADSSTIVGFAKAASSSARPDLKALIGRRFVVISETDPGDVLKASDVKRVSGREAVSARGLYEEQSTFKPSFILFVGTNYEPDIRSDDNGVWRRIKILPFTVDFDRDPRFKGKKNRNLDNELADPRELSGILNRVLEGYRDYVKCGGLNEPKIVTTAGKQYRTEQDTLAEWWDYALVEDTDRKAALPLSELYDSYRATVYRWGVSPLTKRGFFKAMERHAENVCPKSIVRKNRGKVLKGYRLAGPADRDDIEDIFEEAD